MMKFITLTLTGDYRKICISVDKIVTLLWEGDFEATTVTLLGSQEIAVREGPMEIIDLIINGKK